MKRLIQSAMWLLVIFNLTGFAQNTNPFEGMWSDPPITAIDLFCSGSCTDAGIERLTALLDDPDNDDRPYDELASQAAAHQVEQYLRPLLTDAALETFPLDPLDDQGFLNCRPWGVARQVTARHQLELRDEGDRLQMRYGEWAATRTVYMDGRQPPEDLVPTSMGYSVGRYESDTLVIETSGIRADIITRPQRFSHSDQLRINERYTVSDDGERLFLTVTYDDPWSLKEPLVQKKVWSWAPDQQIFPVECEPPDEFRNSEDRP